MITVIILKPECVDVNQLESLVQKVQGCILQLVLAIVNLFKTRTAKHKKTSQVSVVFHDEYLYMLFNVIQLSVRNEITSIVFQGQSYLLQVILS